MRKPLWARLVAGSFHKYPHRQFYLCLPTHRRVRLYQLAILRPQRKSASMYDLLDFHSILLDSTHYWRLLALKKRIDVDRLGTLIGLSGSKVFGFVIELDGVV